MIFWVVLVLGVAASLFLALIAEDGMAFFFGLAATAVVLMVGVVMIGGTIWEETHESKQTHSFEIASLQDNFGAEGEIHGGFFFTTGFIGSYQFYSWYEKQPDGSFEARQVSTRSAPVKVWERPADSPPKVVKHELCADYALPNWLVPFNLTVLDGDCEAVVWELFVPDGTIAHEYKLDGAG